MESLIDRVFDTVVLIASEGHKKDICLMIFCLPHQWSLIGQKTRKNTHFELTNQNTSSNSCFVYLCYQARKYTHNNKIIENETMANIITVS